MHYADNRSPDFCSPDVSFPTLISTRTSIVGTSRVELEEDSWWFHHLDDKVAGYIYAAARGLNPPKIYFCSFDIQNGLDEFATEIAVSSGADFSDGFVVRATHLHSSKGIYALPHGFGGIELIRGINMSLADIKTDLVTIGGTKLVIEQYISGHDDLLPVEYKFHVLGGKVGAVNILFGRGTDCACWAEVDQDLKRLDQYG